MTGLEVNKGLFFFPSHYQKPNFPYFVISFITEELSLSISVSNCQVQENVVSHMHCNNNGVHLTGYFKVIDNTI